MFVSMVLELPKKPAKPQQLTSSGTTSPAKNSEDRKLPGFDGLIVAGVHAVCMQYFHWAHAPLSTHTAHQHLLTPACAYLVGGCCCSSVVV